MFRAAKPAKSGSNHHIDSKRKFRIVHSGMQNDALDKCTARDNDAFWTRLTPADLKGEESMFAIEQAQLALIALAELEQE